PHSLLLVPDLVLSFLVLHRTRLRPSITFATLHLSQRLKTRFRRLHPSVTFAGLNLLQRLKRASVAFTLRHFCRPLPFAGLKTRFCRLHLSVIFAALYLLQRFKTRFRRLRPVSPLLPSTSCSVSFRRLHLLQRLSVAFTSPGVTFAALYLMQGLKTRFRRLHLSVTFAALYLLQRSRRGSVALTLRHFCRPLQRSRRAFVALTLRHVCCPLPLATSFGCLHFTLASRLPPSTFCRVSKLASRLHPSVTFATFYLAAPQDALPSPSSVTFAALYLLQRLNMPFCRVHHTVTFATLYLLQRLVLPSPSPLRHTFAALDLLQRLAESRPVYVGFFRLRDWSQPVEVETSLRLVKTSLSNYNAHPAVVAPYLSHPSRIRVASESLLVALVSSSVASLVASELSSVASGLLSVSFSIGMLSGSLMKSTGKSSCLAVAIVVAAGLVVFTPPSDNPASSWLNCRRHLGYVVLVGSLIAVVAVLCTLSKAVSRFPKACFHLNVPGPGDCRVLVTLLTIPLSGSFAHVISFWSISSTAQPATTAKCQSMARRRRQDEDEDHDLNLKTMTTTSRRRPRRPQDDDCDLKMKTTTSRQQLQDHNHDLKKTTTTNQRPRPQDDDGNDSDDDGDNSDDDSDNSDDGDNLDDDGDNSDDDGDDSDDDNFKLNAT
ncbi:hypothetical protein EDB89DRAFT_2205342, partial [Lactarius sanguifluus]